MTGEPHPSHEHWRANVGVSVDLNHAPVLTSPPPVIDVLCWNVAIGKGRLLERLSSLLEERSDRGAGDRPLVVLLQEAFRTDETIPAAHVSGHHGGQAPREPREDIVTVADALGLSLRYEPSMRNGRHRSDRGNAILSTVAIGDTHTFLLPWVRQRRAAIAMKLAGDCGNLWFSTVHLDTRGAHRPHSAAAEVVRSERGFGGGRATQAAALADALLRTAGPDADILLGGDLNSYAGLRDPAVRILVERGFRHSERVGQWRHTFHGPIRLMLDHVMFCAGSRMKRVRVERLNERADRGRRIFGSDHHPLLATVTY